MKDRQPQLPGAHRAAVLEGSLDLRQLGHLATEHRRLNGQEVIEESVTLVNLCWRSRSVLKPARGSDMIDVCVRVHNRVDTNTQADQMGADDVQVSAWVDNDGALSFGVEDNGTVAAERADPERFNLHGCT